ncbi:MAG: aminotransferase class V-fold PLP-dependent enzyme [Rickettsiales bacterium]|jgi:cysteine desulfurase/selenocysteine lyase|nr:aminotransferase class V-fold PLP-dependent enzyme [Rickettsiales bacterium]
MTEFIYLDAAASALKPESVIEAELDFLRNHYANAGRGVCARAEFADKMVADARSAVARFIGAASPDQIIFTGGATDSLNRIANMLPQDSTVAVSDLDHHSARLPFQEKHKTVLIPLDDDFNYGEIPKCDAAVITAMSNVLGVPQRFTAGGAQLTIIDAAQYVAHEKINVADWNPDALVFSGHKIGADTGLGILYLKEPNRWKTDKFGGGQFAATGPAAFEAGTLPLTQIAGLPSALAESEDRRAESGNLLDYLYGELSKIDRIKIITKPGASLLTFVIDGMHPLDFGALMGANNICLRVGNMCASWLHKRLGYDGTIRISTGPWNTESEIEQAAKVIKKICGQK